MPGDKSLSHRAAVFSALAAGESRIENFLVAGVTQAMLAALSALGFAWRLEGTTLLIESGGLESLQPPRQALHCGHSASTLRMLAGLLAAAGIPAVLDGSPGLRRRPMGRVVEPLRQMGAPIEAAPGGVAPLSLGRRPAGAPLRGIRHQLPVASAQVKTALLLAALAARGPTTLLEPGPSRDHSERLLAHLGVRIEAGAVGKTGYPASITLHPPRLPLPPLRLRLPGDISSAAFLIVAAAITPGSRITLRQVGLNPTRTGLLDALQAMGADLRVEGKGLRHNEPIGDITVTARPLRGTLVSGHLATRAIDEFPALAAAAAFASGVTSIRDAAELRYKESDRISALCGEFSALKAAIEERADGFEISGGAPPRGGAAHAHGDHRLAMALALLGLAASEPVVVHGAEALRESFPGFVETLQALGAQAEWAD